MSRVRKGTSSFTHEVTMFNRTSGAGETGLLAADFECDVVRADGSTPATLSEVSGDFSVTEKNATDYPGRYIIGWSSSVPFAVEGEVAIDFRDISNVALGSRTFDVDSGSFKALIGASYEARSDTLRVVSWLELDGQVVSSGLALATIEIFGSSDPETVLVTLSSSLPSSSGHFNMSVSPLGLDSNVVYWVKVTIVENSGSKVTGTNFVIIS